MSYFDFYNIPITFKVDKAALKRTFYAYSKKYHPDFYTLETEAKQAEILEKSSLNNEAYKVLTDFDKRMKYVLELKEVLQEEGKNKIPQDFLMEMMDINESLMELEFDFDATKYEAVTSELAQLETQLYRQIETIIDNYDDTKATDVELSAIKDYYLKKRYLLRIRENLNKFASL